MISKIKITSKGQITIPKALREKMNLKEGMYMSAYIQDDNLILKPLPQDSNCFLQSKNIPNFNRKLCHLIQKNLNNI